MLEHLQAEDEPYWHEHELPRKKRMVYDDIDLEEGGEQDDLQM